ncbi:ribosomal RNA processing protein 1 homolog B isoform X2 [Chelmon rostratus]|uniref:ribosomal RNA processing protein 1 homolog B isoform X2 n=1 Tax=Chelmon rostratus TaxID=109905 RepID=UPI001BEB832A|nr:ribosomal RNA processing protein 1 homolog B isoform X2 [Chelmon rostratus]
MAAIQEPEVQFAQRLASNEKPIRTKAIKKLRKYITVRSQKATGGFTGDELLKLWKGLFYCLWMQDKPLLQEELSKQISSLIHSFQDVDGQLLYLESFLQTIKREWTGIDRLRMDKFFQLVRFVFRQTFEMLKRRTWDSSVVSRFLELLSAQVLQSSGDAPIGLQFHILDLYMSELAAVGSAELTADQNLIFIQPFCKTAAKTKDRVLFRAVCSSIFSTIINQAPFAIEDLMKEVEAAGASDSDSGQASEEDDEEDRLKGKPSGKAVVRKKTVKQINGTAGDKSNQEEEEEDDDEGDEDDDDELHLEDSDTEAPCDDDIGPVLQFDYTALADKLFELASRSNTPSHNRQRLYKIIKVLRDLSEGVFPQDEYPEEVSTDEDDDMFASRKRMKRGGRVEEDEEGAPASKKRKKKKASKLNKQSEHSAEAESEPADLTVNDENKKKKRKRKKKKKKAAQGGGEGGENAERCEQEQIVGPIKETEGSQKESVNISEAAPPEGQSETLLLSEAKKQPSVTVTPTPGTTGNEEQSEKSSKNKETSELTAAEEQQTPARTETPGDAAASTKKKKRKKALKAKLEKGLEDGTVAESQLSAEAESTPVGSEEPTPEADTTTPGKKKKKGLNLQQVEGDPALNGVSAEEASTTAAKKKSKKKNLKADEATKVEADTQVEVEGPHTDAEITSVGEEASPDASAVQKKTKKKNKLEDTTPEASPADESAATPLKTKRKGNQKESETTQVADAEKRLIGMTTPAKKKKTKPAAAQVEEIEDQTQVQVVGGEDAELPQDKAQVVSPSRKSARKKRKIPVVFEFEADEVEAVASINGLTEEETVAKKTKLVSDAAELSTPLSTKKPQKKAKTPSGSAPDFITFQSDAAVPMPLFYKTKGRPSTPRASKKKIQTPKSESKKVTFGLKNNKTAEFRKTDRSLLVSPDGSSRVPFDPEQKPKFGVLKSPATPLSTRVKKTPGSTRKTSSSTPKSAPKRRPSAADFF